ncbi:MAG: hypothetical protein HC829_07445, partial [Bacteroidales bacterium]|nr:hypothetical protein [Bacteroidales bacterium]
MFPPISPADLATLIDEADAAARRLHRKLVLPAADLADLRQDLLVDLICRLPGFDARRGSIGVFANIVLRNQSARIASPAPPPAPGARWHGDLARGAPGWR